jgi:micrococcal nuclease
MRKTTMKYALSMAICILSTLAYARIKETQTTVTLNSVKTTVHFVDGDTFRILDGNMKDSLVRILGINTLETYGPVHAWTHNTPSYLLDIARLATTLAQKGTWNCVTKNNNDTYGRLLVTCDDLSVALIKAGYAHAYSINSTPAKKQYLTIQKEAQNNQIGMWKYGIPKFVITSLHSADEHNKKPYNRLISTEDGRSKIWHHHESYGPCQKVCLADDDSCMVYVPFEQRYARNRPECLRIAKL